MIGWDEKIIRAALHPWGIFLTEEWIWAAIICALPFLAFGALAMAGAVRRKRFQAIAQRRKSLKEEQ